MTAIRDTWPSWAVTADEVNRRWEDPDPFRHDMPEPALWPEVVGDRCYICHQPVEDGLMECPECFLVGDAAYERRQDV